MAAREASKLPTYLDDFSHSRVLAIPLAIPVATPISIPIGILVLSADTTPSVVPLATPIIVLDNPTM